MVEKGADHRRVQVVERQLRGLLPAEVVDEHEQHPEAAPISDHRVWAGVALLAEAFGEEGL